MNHQCLWLPHFYALFFGTSIISQKRFGERRGQFVPREPDLRQVWCKKSEVKCYVYPLASLGVIIFERPNGPIFSYPCWYCMCLSHFTGNLIKLLLCMQSGSTLSVTISCLVHEDIKFSSGQSKIQNRDIKGQPVSVSDCHSAWNDSQVGG